MLGALFGPPDISKLETKKNAAKLAAVASKSKDPSLRQAAADAFRRVLILSPETAHQVREIDSLDESLQAEVVKSLHTVQLLSQLEQCDDAVTFVQTAGRIGKLNRGAAAVRKLYDRCGQKRSQEWDWQIGRALGSHGADYEELTLDLVQNGLKGPSALYFINQALERLRDNRQPIKDPRAVDILAAALTFKDDQVCRSAAGALGLTEDPRAIPLLVGRLLLETNIYIAREIHGALTKLGWSPEDMPQRVPLLFLSSREEDREELVSNGGMALDYLVRIARTDDEGSATARSLIANIKDPRAIERLLELADTEGERIRERALEALEGYRDTVALPELAGLLIRSKSKHRWVIARALGNYEDSLAVDTLIFALSQPDWELRAEAAARLGERKDSRAVEPLLRLKAEIGDFPDFAPESERAYFAVKKALENLGQVQ